jgi:hypothetical protein
MEISDLPKMQQDFLTRMAESSERLSAAWAEVAKGVKAGKASVDYKSVAPGWMNPWEFQNVVSSPSAAVRFQEMIDSAATDIPELLKHGRDEMIVKNIKAKWLKSYRNLVGEMFGIPRRSQTEKYLEQWRTLLGSLSGARSGFGGGLLPDFSAMISSMESFFQSDTTSKSSGLNIWIESYEKTLGHFFRFPGGSLTREYEARAKRAMDAQIKFLDSLPGFQEQIVAAAEKGLEKVIDKVLSLGVEQISPETYRMFYKVWINTHEEALVELFRSERFSESILDAVKRGVDAKQKMDSLVADNLAFWNVPSQRDLDAVLEEVRTLRDHVNGLQEEIGALKVELAQYRKIDDAGEEETKESPLSSEET